MSTIKLLENMINYCSAKNNVISKNLANIGTENYQRKDVVFKDIFSSQMNSNLKTTSQRHLSSEQPDGGMEKPFVVVEDSSTEMTSGINNVDVEREMADLAENTLQYKFASKKISSYYKNLQSVIKGEKS